MKVYLDTNVFVSAFATRGLCADLFQAGIADHQLVVGETVLVELRRILSRKLRMAPGLIDEVEAFLRSQGEVVRDPPPAALNIRDPADRVVLAEAVAGGAEVLVTGDADLLSVAPRAPLPIVAPRAFWELLKTGPRPAARAGRRGGRPPRARTPRSTQTGQRGYSSSAWPNGGFATHGRPPALVSLGGRSGHRASRSAPNRRPLAQERGMAA